MQACGNRRLRTTGRSQIFLIQKKNQNYRVVGVTSFILS